METKKTVLLLGDDIRTFSGVANQSRELLFGLKERGFNCVQIGASQGNKDKPQPVLWNDIKIYPSVNYGNQRLVEQVMSIENPDYMIIFTDPRYWRWLFQFEDSIRSKTPLLYYHLWDNEPYPFYNEIYYKSCDWIGCINRQSVDFVENVTKKEFDRTKWNLKYIPHGIDIDKFKPLTIEDKHQKEFNEQFYGGNYDKFKYKILFNSRNAWRKNPANLMWAYNKFVKSLPTKEEQDQCLLVLHTDVIDNVGTDLDSVRRDLYPDVKIMFSTKKLDPKYMPLLYNSVDVTVCPSSAEGFGLSFAESIMCGTPVISTITGGLQDQMNIKYKDNCDKDYMHDDVWLGLKNGTNQIESHGEWCIPLMPEARVMKGSVPTPYIYEDYYSNDELTNAIYRMYHYDDREARGEAGRKWMIDNNFTTTKLVDSFVEQFNVIDKNWKPVNNKRLAKI